MIKAARAIYKKGQLVFIDKKDIPDDGSEVIVTFVEKSADEISESNAIAALKGRGKGENLGEKLLKSRQEDLEHDERNYQRIRS